MHKPTELKINGSIDGTVRCSCGWSRYFNYPGRGWARNSVGIKMNHPGETKREWLSRKGMLEYAQHAMNHAA